jgi:RimJ/RimL family protein N-acetyltransferase
MKTGAVVEFESADRRHVLLRSLTMRDIEAVTRFANAIVKEKKTNLDLGLVGFDRRVTVKEERKFLRALVEGEAKREAVSIGAFVDGRLVGHCDVRRRKAADERHVGTFGIVILDGYRGVGIGQMMVKEALVRSRRLGVWLVELSVFAINARAIHVYEKMGFRRAGVVPNKMLRKGRLMDEVSMYVEIRGTSKSPSPRRRQG